MSRTQRPGLQRGTWEWPARGWVWILDFVIAAVCGTLWEGGSSGRSRRRVLGSEMKPVVPGAPVASGRPPTAHCARLGAGGREDWSPRVCGEQRTQFPKWFKGWAKADNTRTQK